MIQTSDQLAGALGEDDEEGPPTAAAVDDADELFRAGDVPFRTQERGDHVAPAALAPTWAPYRPT